MERTKKIFISDVHMGPGLDTDWFTNDNKKVFKKFLKWIAGRDDVAELVLLGDMFDTWVCKMDRKPPTIQEILDHQHDVVPLIQDCVEKLDTVFYINGNHDMHVKCEDLGCFTKGGKDIKCVKEYRSGLMYAVHGNQFAMFNARDPQNAPHNGLPLGYFISRMVAGDPNYLSPGAMVGYVEDCLEAVFTSDTLSECVIEALMEEEGLSPDSQFVMPGARKDITIQDVRNKYKDLFHQWVQKHGYWYAVNAVLAELEHLEWFAKRLHSKNDYKVVVMGHTHHSRWLKEGDFIYANSGYWCTDKDSIPHFVEVEKTSGKIYVKLVPFDEDGPKDPVNEGEV